MPIKKPIKIFNVPWHVAHQYELYKVPNTQWTHCINVVRKWSSKGKSFRPYPTNVDRVVHFEKGKYDLAILHIDQQCVDPTFGKSKLFTELNEAVGDIPKIIIQHGTPFWPEVYSEDYIKMKMKGLVGDAHMVYNSHRSQEMWGDMGSSGTTIIHGLDPKEWFDLPKEPRCITTMSPAGLDKYYNRRLLESVKDKLKQRGIAHCHITVDKIMRDFDEYREFIGRSLLYFNPTLESCMPRSRTEAMLSGACIITLPNHGAEKFIKHGVNGFHVPNNPVVIADLIENLMNKGLYKKCIEIGQRGKETALKEFGQERYQEDWANLINKVLGL